MSKGPVNVFTSLQIDSVAGVENSVFAPVVLTTAERDAIPLDDLRAGGIIYNITVGSLQTYTINGWENIAVSGGGTDVFDNITVNQTATTNNLTATGTTTLAGLTSSALINTTALTASGTINTNNLIATSAIGTANANITGSGAVNALSANIAGTIYGPRPSGSFYYKAAGTFVFAGGSAAKLDPGATTAPYLNQFTSATQGRITYTGVGQSPINVLINFTISAQYSASGGLGFLIIKNGTGAAISTPSTNVTATNFFNSNTSMITSLATNDYLEVWVSGIAGTLSAMEYALIATQI